MARPAARCRELDVKITPALPNPYQPPPRQDSKAVAAVRATHHPRPAGDESQRQQARARAADQVEAGRSTARLERQHFGAHARRALSVYQQVAAVDRRSDLRELLGFDAYA